MPHPPGKRSVFLIYSGFTISKNLNRISPHIIYVTVTGTNSKLMHIPATSSITTRAGSLPQTGTNMVDDHTPISVIDTVIITDAIAGGKLPCQHRYQIKQQATAAAVPAPLPLLM